MHILRRSLLPKISSTFFNQVVKERVFFSRSALDVGQPTASTHPQLLKKGEITPGISSDEYIWRRKKLLELLPKNAVAIIASAPVKMMTDVVPYTFRQDADYLYITGCQQPGGIAVLSHDCGLCMFMPEACPADLIWHGETAGVVAALRTFKADEAYPITALNKILSSMIDSSSQVFHIVNKANSAYTNLEEFQKAAYNGKVKDFSVYSHEARWIKSEAEINLLRDSAAVACQALLQTMLHSKSFPSEGMLSAKFEYECKMRGAQRMAFNPVVGGGRNGSVIHYARNDQIIQDGDMVLMDVGCELHGYVSDLTRTFSPCGRFSSVQCFPPAMEDLEQQMERYRREFRERQQRSHKRWELLRKQQQEIDEQIMDKEIAAVLAENVGKTSNGVK
ncbi:aminopeptidase [Orobanche gracilis]